jgi:HTH-type transcriptional regulator / antitoxin HigA
MNLATAYGKTQDRYLELIRAFPLRPLRTPADLDAAIRILRQLHDHPSGDAAEGDYADVLGELIDRYQNAGWASPPSSTGEVLGFLLESRDLSPAQLAAATGIPEGTLTDVLAGARLLGPEQMERLATYFHVLPSAFTSGSVH